MGEEPALTAHYRQLAHTLHTLGCGGRVRVYAPGNILEPDTGILHTRALTLPTEVTLPVLAENGSTVDIPLADLAWLAAEVTTILPPEAMPPDSELLDILASIYCQGSDLTLHMLQAKRADLLKLCRWPAYPFVTDRRCGWLTAGRQSDRPCARLLG